MTTDELNAIVQAVMLELEKAGVDFDFKAETPQPTDLVYVMRGTSDKYQGITVKWQNLLDIIVQKATEAKNEAVSAKDIALQTLATIQGIESNVSSMKTSVETTKSQVETMKASVETSEVNVTQMKSDVSEMKTSVEGTKTEVEGLKSDVTNLKTQTQTIVDNAKEEVTGLLGTKVNYSDSLTYEEIMATTPPISLDVAVPKASAVKTLGNNSWKRFNFSGGADYADKPWLLLKDNWSSLTEGICFGTLNCAGIRFYIGYKNDERYGVFLVMMYVDNVPMYRVVKKNNNWYYIKVNESETTSF